MDFFAGQDHARRNTSLLVGLFILAVLALVLLANVLVLACLGIYNQTQVAQSVAGGAREALVFDQTLFLAISAGILLIVALASSFRMVQLSKGGQVIAEGLGGKRVSMDTTDASERRLLNVVAEMAIASGTPVPRVYVLEGESGINAFAVTATATSQPLLGQICALFALPVPLPICQQLIVGTIRVAGITS